MRSQFSASHLLWLAIAAVVAVAMACSGSSPKSPTAATSVESSSSSASGSVAAPGTGGTGTGTLKVVITDSPFSEASAVLVTFSEVSAHKSGDGTSDGEWIALSFEDVGGQKVNSRTCDLTQLQGATDLLGVGKLKEGHYTQLRLTVSSVTIYKTATMTDGPCVAKPVLSDTTDKGSTVDVPSGTLKLNREFDVPADGATTITLDFDGDKSIHQTGNGKYKMTPVIGVVSVG